VINVPGAGGSIGVRRGMESKPDGLTSFRVSQRFLLKEIVGDKFDYFDSSKAIILGADNNSQPQMWYVRRSVATSWDDILKLGRQVTEGATGPEPVGQELAGLLGYPIRFVYGYGGAAQVRAAFARGEIEATDLLGPHMLKLYPDLVKQSAYVPIFWWGADPKKDQQAIDYLKELGAEAPPYIFDVVKATPDQQTVFQIGADFPTATTFFPPGVRSEIVTVWKEVMAKTYQDEEMKRRSLEAGTSVEWIPAERIQDMMDRGRKVVENPEHKKLLMNLMGDR
jgi:tripartite-type tricarboxylate transporter receptor subunit TctC